MLKTRTRQLADGRTEVIRLLDPHDLQGASNDDPLFYEKSIVWLEDITAYRFVRVSLARGVHSRRGPLHATGVGRVVGYAKLTLDAPKDPVTHGYTRRLFYVKDSDLERTDWPSNAVDPRQVLPGVAPEPHPAS